MIASFVLTPIISYSLSGRVQLIGLPNALSMVGRAGAGYPLGWLLDKAGRRIGLAVGLSFVIFGMLVSASAIGAGSLALFLGGAVLLGMGPIRPGTDPFTQRLRSSPCRSRPK